MQDDLSKTGVCQDPSVNDWDVLLDGTFTAEWTSCSHPEESGTHKLNVMRVEWEVAKLADARGLIPFEKGHDHEHKLHVREHAAGEFYADIDAYYADPDAWDARFLHY